ncbi:MAG: alpha/beta hydrolase [Akkermansia sp.]|nr:alpha/beta hydrolase [Akkermansia sp.]
MQHICEPMEIFTDAEHLAEARYRRLLKEQSSFIWRRFSDGVELRAYVFLPPNHDTSKSAPSVLFFHGGMWVGKSLGDFVPWAIHLAQQGIVGIIPMYRTFSEYDVSAVEILDDAKEAWHWVYDNSQVLGLDPTRITVAGSDAGGLMALHVALPAKPKSWSIKNLFKREKKTEPAPAAIALFRGVCDIQSEYAYKLTGKLNHEQKSTLNPIHRLQKGLPPLFASHGGRDRLLPWQLSEKLVKYWNKKSNPAQFELLDVADHNYYHFNVNAAYFEQVLNCWSAFMFEHSIWDYSESMDAELLI